MSVQIKRKVLDFLAEDYTTCKPKVTILHQGPDEFTESNPPRTKMLQRWYLSLKGENSPIFSQVTVSKDTGMEQFIYRYDWAFGITCFERFNWNWMGELCDVAIHIVLEPVGNAPEAIPISAALSTLSPSRNTKGFWEQAWPKIPGMLADLAKVGAPALPLLNYLPGSLTLTSNVLESQSENQKNWFLYQFLDEKRKCPVVEWRVNQGVFEEYGPLLRGTLFVVFDGSTESSPGCVRMLMRPQIRYCKTDDICFIIPTETGEFRDDQQVYIEVKPQEKEGLAKGIHLTDRAEM